MSQPLLQKVRSKIPSRNTLIFWGSVFGLASYHFYNKQRCKEQMESVKKRASALADVPMSTTDLPKKVCVIVSNQPGEFSTTKTMEHWRKYVMPVFYAGALDYDVIEIENHDKENNQNEGVGIMEGFVHEYVSNSIKKHLRDKLETLYPELKNQRLAASSSDGNEIEQFQVPDDRILDIVAIGRNAFAESFNGIVDAYTTSLDLVVEKPVPAQASEIPTPVDLAENLPSTTTEEKTESTIEETPTAEQNPSELSPIKTTIEYSKFAPSLSEEPLPAIAYLQIKLRSGWSSIPKAIYRFFNDYEYTKLYSEQALRVVLDVKRPWNQEIDTKWDIEDEKLKPWHGKNAIFVENPSVSDKLNVYSTIE
ncbi:hypothetical protein BB560_002649 [Smittium megazygosporum]|uniref:Mitochondrial import inner membrane translocase subunit TIM54 n=1 Tax=Smittium megazygosporum TaxID=133381 RepID=A0A2T9ZEC1_9FUNG|nr:hypothetical protein BB560_002649 [Smittium megazygosporum]